MSSPSIQEVVAVFGQPVAGNPTQYIMEKAFAKAGLDWRYLTLEVAPGDLPDANARHCAMGFRGCNLTIPHKVTVIPLLNRMSEAATLMGAVNCVNRIGDELVGENTDGKGFLQSLRQLTDPAGKSIVLFGAGSAVRAIAVEVALAGAADITIVNRSIQRGQGLVDLIHEKLHVPARLIHWQGKYEIPPATDVVINATSIGLNDAQASLPLELSTLKAHMIVADVMFNPPETRLLQDAQAAGCQTLDGLGMLVNQAVICFAIWTGGATGCRKLMRDSLEEFLGFNAARCSHVVISPASVRNRLSGIARSSWT